ncbi:hypothetical protein Brsp07_00364 [Brucella sp. NBRC 14130]|uniref:helix-turn-helix domain-containing protein n=1 Tax=Brucella sp. NBRC 14130 TaxID=3075483 RepID=UPI0030AB7330
MAPHKSKKIIGVPAIPRNRYRVHADGDTGVLCGVYFLIDDAEVTYIGQSKNIIARIGQHMAAGKRFTEFTYIKCAPENLNLYERRLVLLYKPRDNISMLMDGEAGTAEIARLAADVPIVLQDTKQKSKKFMGVKEVAQYTGLSKSTLDKLRHFGGGPRYFKLGRAVKYEQTDIDEWVALRARTCTWGEGSLMEIHA